MCNEVDNKDVAKLSEISNCEISQEHNESANPTSSNENKVFKVETTINSTIPYDYKTFTEEENKFYETFLNYNWSKLKPSDVENFQKFIRLRIKMILNGELEPEKLYENLPRKLCVKINKVIIF